MVCLPPVLHRFSIFFVVALHCDNDNDHEQWRHNGTATAVLLSPMVAMPSFLGAKGHYAKMPSSE
jgi:hypothetical protein